MTSPVLNRSNGNTSQKGGKGETMLSEKKYKGILKGTTNELKVYKSGAYSDNVQKMSSNNIGPMKYHQIFIICTTRHIIYCRITKKKNSNEKEKKLNLRLDMRKILIFRWECAVMN